MFGVGNVPPDDFQFPHPVWDSPHPTILRANTREKLLAVIRQYRIDAGLPIGNPELDYDNYQQELQDVREGKRPAISGYPIPLKPIPRNLSDRIAQWASNRYSKAQTKITYVDRDEAERRANICLRCPKNEEWEITESCAPCLDNTKRNLLMLRRGNETSLHRDLKGCSCFGHDNKAAVWLPADLLKHRVQHAPEAPDFCWLKNLQPDGN